MHFSSTGEQPQEGFAPCPCSGNLGNADGSLPDAQVENEKRVWQALGYPAQHGLVQLRAQGEVASVEGHKADHLAGSAVVVTAPWGTPLASMQCPSGFLSDPSSLVADVGGALHLLQVILIR